MVNKWQLTDSMGGFSSTRQAVWDPLLTSRDQQVILITNLVGYMEDVNFRPNKNNKDLNVEIPILC